MADSFEALGIQPWLSSQCAALAMVKPTDVQVACIPHLLGNNNNKSLVTNVVGGAATGSGKTAAFALPIIQVLSEEMYGVFALVLTPSRELAYQIIDQFIALGAPVAIRTAIAIGGVHHSKQLEAIVARPHIVVATPGRLRMLLETFPSEVQVPFRNLRYIVFDEADRLTEGDIKDDVFECVRLLGPKKPFRQTILMSATIDSRLTTFSEGILGKLGITEEEPLKACCCNVAESTSHGSCVTYRIAPNIDQKYLFVPNFVKLPYTVCLLKTLATSESAIIFCNSCFRSEVLRLTLQLLGFPVCSLNSLLLQKHRLNNLAMFKANIAKILVATDIAARGLDILDVNVVIHYDFPKMSSTYVHRIGRTARADNTGTSVAIITENDVSLVHKVERKTKSKFVLLKHPKVTDDTVEMILDEVSTAKVQAKLQVESQFGNRAETLKKIGQERRSDINKAIRGDWGQRSPISAGSLRVDKLTTTTLTGTVHERKKDTHKSGTPKSTSEVKEARSTVKKKKEERKMGVNVCGSTSKKGTYNRDITLHSKGKRKIKEEEESLQTKKKMRSEKMSTK